MTNDNFNSMQELADYLSVLENRILFLEKDNKELKDAINEVSNETILPQTNLFNSSFLSRAFAVWGHFFVSNLVISIIFYVIYFLVIVVLLGNVLGNIQ